MYDKFSIVKSQFPTDFDATKRQQTQGDRFEIYRNEINRQGNGFLQHIVDPQISNFVNNPQSISSFNPTASLYPINFPSDPTISGPGMWFFIHRKARRLGKTSTTSAEIQNYIDDVKDIITHHPCGDCRQHGSNYLKDDPIENYVDMVDNQGRHIGMFYWSWKFHNSVNRRLGKPEIPYEIAWKMYEEDGISICQHNCGSNNSVSTSGEEVPKISLPPTSPSNYQSFPSFNHSRQLSNNFTNQSSQLSPSSLNITPVSNIALPPVIFNNQSSTKTNYLPISPLKHQSTFNAPEIMKHYYSNRSISNGRHYT